MNTTLINNLLLFPFDMFDASCTVVSNVVSASCLTKVVVAVPRQLYTRRWRSKHEVGNKQKTKKMQTIKGKTWFSIPSHHAQRIAIHGISLSPTYIYVCIQPQTAIQTRPAFPFPSLPFSKTLNYSHRSLNAMRMRMHMPMLKFL